MINLLFCYNAGFHGFTLLCEINFKRVETCLWHIIYPRCDEELQFIAADVPLCVLWVILKDPAYVS